jgi:hypothetical protein
MWKPGVSYLRVIIPVSRWSFDQVSASLLVRIHILSMYSPVHRSRLSAERYATRFRRNFARQMLDNGTTFADVFLINPLAILAIGSVPDLSRSFIADGTVCPIEHS